MKTSSEKLTQKTSTTLQNDKVVIANIEDAMIPATAPLKSLRPMKSMVRIKSLKPTRTVLGRMNVGRKKV